MNGLTILNAKMEVTELKFLPRISTLSFNVFFFRRTRLKRKLGKNQECSAEEGTTDNESWENLNPLDSPDSFHLLGHELKEHWNDSRPRSPVPLGMPDANLHPFENRILFCKFLADLCYNFIDSFSITKERWRRNEKI